MRGLHALLIILLLAIAPIALANDADGDKSGHDDAEANDTATDDSKTNETKEAKDDDQEDGLGKDSASDDDDERRKVEISASGDNVEIKLKQEAAGVEDEVKIVYHADEGMMKVEYKTENATTETETELKVKFREVVEFVDTDGDGAYTPKTDRDVQRLNLDDLDWTVTPPTDVTSASGVAGKRIVGTGTFRDNGTLAFVLYVYGDFANVNGTTLRPSEVKIDILFEDFAYQAPDSQLALIVKAEQESEIEVEEKEDGQEVEGLQATANGFTAYFTWADNATVDGAVTPVVTTVLDSEAKDNGSERKYALAYARGASINHDPVLGVQSAGEPSSVDARGTPGPGVLLAAAAVGVAALALRRK